MEIFPLPLDMAKVFVFQIFNNGFISDPFPEQVQEMQMSANVMKGTHLISQLAKEETCLFRICLGVYKDSKDGCSFLC